MPLKNRVVPIETPAFVHYGKKGMRWGVINEKQSRKSAQKKREQDAEKSAEARSAEAKARIQKKIDAANARTAAQRKAAAGGGAGGGTAGTDGLDSPKTEEPGSPEEAYSKAFAEALGDPPHSPEDIKRATEAAEKAQAEAEGEGGGEDEKDEKEEKGGGKGGEDKKEAEKKAAEKAEAKRQKTALERTEAALAGTEIANAMGTGKPRSPEALAKEAEGISKMLKMVEHDPEAYEQLFSIGARSHNESKGGPPRSAEQLKKDAEFVKKLSERFSKEADFMRNFGKKKDDDKVKHSGTVPNYAYYLMHYGVKGMKWGVRRERARKAQRMNREMHGTQQRKKIKSAVKTAAKWTIGQTQDQKDLRAHDKAVRDATIQDAKAGVSSIKQKIGNRFRKGVANRQEKIANEYEKIGKEFLTEAGKSKKRLDVLRKEADGNNEKRLASLKAYEKVIAKNGGKHTKEAKEPYQKFINDSKATRKAGKKWIKEQEHYHLMKEAGDEMMKASKDLRRMSADNRKRKSGLAK